VSAVASSTLSSTVGQLGHWSPGFGDPTALGWLATLGYLATGLACVGVARKTPTVLREARLERILWFALSALYLALGVNKQLDLQTALTEIGRILAHALGWDDIHHLIQRAFVLLLAAVVAVVGVGLALLSWRFGNDVRLTVLGTGLVFAFIVLRAALFHHVDSGSWLATSFSPALELAGIGVTITGAIRRAKALRGVSRARKGSA